MNKETKGKNSMKVVECQVCGMKCWDKKLIKAYRSYKCPCCVSIGSMRIVEWKRKELKNFIKQNRENNND